ncbi:MAG TPA: homoserine O-succinyltransferase [Bacillota bacterium]|nr:homoserine O-succinyltransferase [Bacillota bacterium]
MPIKIPERLPAAQLLEKENVFVMTESRAQKQDIRPLKIAILNLMPKKSVTETQFIRLLANTPLQIELTLLYTETHRPKNTPMEYLTSFYKVFDDIKSEKYDGLIITGAPVETLEFEQVNYWDELCCIIDWAKKNVYSTMFVCWGAQAGLYHNYGIGKVPVQKKISGIFRHAVLQPDHPLVRGFDERFYAPHSRYTEISLDDVVACEDLIPLAISDEAGLYLISSKNGREVYITGHAEYDLETLSDEYVRDKRNNKPIDIPKNYFPENNPVLPPLNMWRAHANLLFSNWLNYFVYQNTPFNISEIK